MDYLSPRSISLISVLPTIPIVHVVDLVKVVYTLIACTLLQLREVGL
jgi:hypothetical protein